MRRFRKSLGIWLFERTESFLRWSRIVINVVSLVVFGLMIARYGFSFQGDISSVWIASIRFFYLVYALNVVFRFVLARKKGRFLLDNWFEVLIFLMIVANGVSYFIFSVSQIQKMVGMGSYELFLLLFLLPLAFIEFVKSLDFIISSKVKPATLFLGSYVLLIVVGAGLLSLPGFNVKHQFLNVFDALFMSASAVCITGLSTFSVSEFFNIKGQILLLILFQIGGIGILTFASFFATFIRKGLGIKHQIMMNELFATDSISSSFSLLKRILVLLFGIELIGILAMLLLWGEYPFESFEQKLFYSVFHTVSAFCNAGFSLIPDGFQNKVLSTMYLWQWLIIGLVFMGSLGFPAIRDMFSVRRLRERVEMPWKDWSLGTKISVYMSVALLVLGAVMYYILVGGKEAGVLGRLTTAVFQSVNLRSGGMSAISLENIVPSVALISMLLMFIGGGSSSMAGGIKTSTFVVSVVAILSTIRGKKEATLARRTISSDLIYRAFTVILFSGSFVLLVLMVLTFTEPDIPFLKLAFETVSAFGNTGLSMGITEELSNAGKVVLSVAMFGGRVGLLTLAFALSSKEKPNTVHYPKTHIIIG